MSDTVADFLVKRLLQWNIHRIFGFPGDGINGILGALQRAKDNPRFIQVRHEEMAALMACGHAKFTGEVGVCLATSGPERFIYSTAFTTRKVTISLWWRS